MKIRYLELRNWKTGETFGLVDVSDKTERQIERIEMGMLRNLHEDWYIYDSDTGADERSPIPTDRRHT